MEKNNAMVNNIVIEKEKEPLPGMLMLILFIVGCLVSIALVVVGVNLTSYVWGAVLLILGIIGCVLFPVLCAGLKVVNPNEALVLTLFGKYYGTIKQAGFFFVNPFCTGFNPTAKTALEEIAEYTDSKKKGGGKKSASVSKKVSTKTMTLNNAQQKVNDVQGNPVIIGSVVIWKVTNPTKAVFNVENYFDYLSTQCDSTIRNTARLYPYDSIEGDDCEMTLRGSSLEIAERMKEELQAKTADAGIEILEVRITHLAYSEEIAAAMLKRQQAAATIAAREQIVEGAVGMVHMALDRLEQDDLIVLDDERKAAMVSNLLVVLCGDKDAQPIVNSGSLY
ncbi:MAG: SPFH domain-containing protein [Lentihominibacter sp.]